MKRTSQPQLIGGYLLLAFGIFFLVFFFITLVSMIARPENSYLGVALFMLFLPGAGSVVWSIFIFKSYKVSQKARLMGTDSTCIVFDKKLIGHRGGSVDFEIIVRFQALKSNEEREHSFWVNEEFYTAVKLGDKLKCRVLDDICYVDEKDPHFVTDVEIQEE